MERSGFIVRSPNKSPMNPYRSPFFSRPGNPHPKLCELPV